MLVESLKCHTPLQLVISNVTAALPARAQELVGWYMAMGRYLLGVLIFVINGFGYIETSSEGRNRADTVHLADRACEDDVLL